MSDATVQQPPADAATAERPAWWAPEVQTMLDQLDAKSTELDALNERRDTLYAERMVLFRALRGRDPEVPFDDIGAAAHQSGGAVRVAMHKQQVRDNAAAQAAAKTA